MRSLSSILLISLLFSTGCFSVNSINHEKADAPATTITLSNKAISIENKLQQGVDISNVDLQGLSAKELYVLQYVPEARYGNPFNDNAELKAFFSSRPWYRPNTNYDGSMLSQTDVYNFNAVQQAFFDAEKRGDSALKPSLPDEPQNVSAPTPNPLEVEGQNFAKTYWDKYLIKCGASYFYKPNIYVLMELKDSPRFYFYGEQFQPRSLSRAEQLNGTDPLPVEWRGVSGVQFDAARQYSGGRAGNWVSDTRAKWSVTISKSKGKWSVEGSPASEISCNNLRYQG